MWLLFSTVLMTITVGVTCYYDGWAMWPPLTEVPNDISPKETEVVLSSNAISSLDGRLDHLTNTLAKFRLMGKQVCYISKFNTGW